MVRQFILFKNKNSSFLTLRLQMLTLCNMHCRVRECPTRVENKSSTKRSSFTAASQVVSSRIVGLLVYTAIFEKNMRNSTVNYLIPDWLTAVT